MINDKYYPARTDYLKHVNNPQTFLFVAPFGEECNHDISRKEIGLNAFVLHDLYELIYFDFLFLCPQGMQ